MMVLLLVLLVLLLLRKDGARLVAVEVPHEQRLVAAALLKTAR